MSDVDWGYSDDYMSATLTSETPHGVFRAVVEVDEHPLEPENEYGCPVYRLDHRWGYTSASELVYGHASDTVSGVDIVGALNYLNGDVDTLNRYLKIFHGGSVVELHSTVYQGGDDFLAYDTRAMREHWGQYGDMLDRSDPDAQEWQAYLDGEVYVVSVERATDFDPETGEPADWTGVEDPVWGFYGEFWARQEAVASLNWAISQARRGMLPLDDAS